jgi:hypothetical protein
MMKHFPKKALAMAVLATTSLPILAESIDVRVIGTISPAACTPTLSGGGTIDYGTINSKILSADAYTVLPEKKLDFSIVCDAPAKVALRAVSGRPGTTAGDVEGGGSNATVVSGLTIFGIPDVNVVGLGLDGAKKIGGYGIRIEPATVTADGVAVVNIHKRALASLWNRDVYSGQLVDAYFNRQTSWAVEGARTPVAFTTLAGKLSVQAYINYASELDLTKPIVLDGLTTIELVYL